MTKMIIPSLLFKVDNWQTLFIAKHKSVTFNVYKMAKGKHKCHFTDDTKITLIFTLSKS